MVNTPISFVEPNRFFTPRKIRNPWFRSPSKYKTESTMCSNVRGPATFPSFVTCPTIKIAIPYCLATCISLAVTSRTCVTVPGADPTSSTTMVCIESMITTLALLFVITRSILSMSLSHRRSISFSNTPIRSARILICDSDSSPET